MADQTAFVEDATDYLIAALYDLRASIDDDQRRIAANEAIDGAKLIYRETGLELRVEIIDPTAPAAQDSSIPVPLAARLFTCAALERELSVGDCVRNAISRREEPCSMSCPIGMAHCQQLGTQATAELARIAFEEAPPHATSTDRETKKEEGQPVPVASPTTPF